MKIVLAHGGIDFIVAADVTASLAREKRWLIGRDIEVESPVEILAKKLFYRAASLAPRDVYDLSAAIDLAPGAAAAAAVAARSKRSVLARRFEELRSLSASALLGAIVPYAGALPHADRMVLKTRDFVLGEIDRHLAAEQDR